MKAIEEIVFPICTWLFATARRFSLTRGGMQRNNGLLKQEQEFGKHYLLAQMTLTSARGHAEVII